MEKPFCQSCAMPMETEEYGTNKDGSPNQEYCKYCYQDGAFTSDQTMEEMIETCVKYMATEESGIKPEDARAQMMEIFPKLARWKA